MATKEKMYYDSDTARTFKEAFAEARSEGKKTFEWNGEKYTTKVKEKDKGPDQSEAETKRLSRKSEEAGKEDRKPTNRGGAAALAGAGVGLGAAALLGGMRKSEEQRKEREMEKASGKEHSRSPVRNITPEEAAFENEGGRAFRKGGIAKKYATGGLTPAERKALMDEKVAPPRGTTKQSTDIFKPGMKPPVDDDMGSAQPGQPGQPAKKKAKGGSIKSASSRADGCAIRGKTRA
jgi:hypothetical protein